MLNSRPLALLGAARMRLWAWTRPQVSELVYVNGGLGDELMLTAVVHAARIADRPVHILTDLPELWTGNADPLSVQTGVEAWHYARRRGWITTEFRHLAYQTGAPGHLAAQMAGHLGLSLPGDWRPLVPWPIALVRDTRLVVLQNSCRGARYAATTKEWPQDRWGELCRRLRNNFELVQLGTVHDPALPHTIDRRGRTSLLQAAEILGRAGLFIGLESGLQHLAAAMHTPAVIIFGGRSWPQETGYLFNCNLTRSPACAGCGLNDGCPHSLVCLDIPVDEVEAAVRAKLAALQPA